MSMTLTALDLQSIQRIVKDEVEESAQITAIAFDTVFKKLDNLQHDLNDVKSDLSNTNQDLSGVKQDLSQVKYDLADVQQTVGRIETLQQTETIRADRHDAALGRLQKKLGISPGSRATLKA